MLGQVSRLEHHVETATAGPFNPARELRLLTDAIHTAQSELESMADRAAPTEQAIFQFQSMMLDDEGMMYEVRFCINAGIGAAAARRFYPAGYRVAVLYHSNAEAAAALEAELPGITAVQCDVASRASCELAFRAAEQALGRVDVLVRNAGIAQQKLFTDITPEEWQRMLDVNLSGAFHLCQLALPGMIRRKAGRILTVSSMWGQTGGSCEVHYSAAKAGLIGLTKALAKEEGPSGITVNCVAPGVIDTDMMAAFTAED